MQEEQDVDISAVREETLRLMQETHQAQIKFHYEVPLAPLMSDEGQVMSFGHDEMDYISDEIPKTTIISEESEEAMEVQLNRTDAKETGLKLEEDEPTSSNQNKDEPSKKRVLRSAKRAPTPTPTEESSKPGTPGRPKQDIRSRKGKELKRPNTSKTKSKKVTENRNTDSEIEESNNNYEKNKSQSKHRPKTDNTPKPTPNKSEDKATPNEQEITEDEPQTSKQNLNTIQKKQQDTSTIKKSKLKRQSEFSHEYSSESDDSTATKLSPRRKFRVSVIPESPQKNIDYSSDIVTPGTIKDLINRFRNKSSYTYGDTYHNWAIHHNYPSCSLTTTTLNSMQSSIEPYQDLFLNHIAGYTNMELNINLLNHIIVLGTTLITSTVNRCLDVNSRKIDLLYKGQIKEVSQASKQFLDLHSTISSCVDSFNHTCEKMSREIAGLSTKMDIKSTRLSGFAPSWRTIEPEFNPSRIQEHINKDTVDHSTSVPSGSKTIITPAQDKYRILTSRTPRGKAKVAFINQENLEVGKVLYDPSDGSVFISDELISRFPEIKLSIDQDYKTGGKGSIIVQKLCALTGCIYPVNYPHSV